MSISSFFADVLHAPLRNIGWSWGALNPDTGVVALRLWRIAFAPSTATLRFFTRVALRTLDKTSERST